MNQSLDPAVVAANAYKLVLENERVRVFMMKFAAGDRAALHEHPDHVIHFLDDANLRLTRPRGKTQDITAHAGDTMFLNAEQHEAVNIGANLARVLVVEMK
jgi:quercetin dioxygenase-like cupin family protein